MPVQHGLPTTISEVLQTMEQMNRDLLDQKSYMLVFGLVYYRVTRAIRDAIEEGRFEDGPRMEALDVTFANLYINAYRRVQAGQPCSGSWQLAFNAASRRYSLIQHLLAGMNAHINLDLGHAAARTAPGADIHDLETDFMRVNEILISLTQEMQAGLGRVSPLLFLLDWIGQRSDERIANFSMVKARNFAWMLALKLAPLYSSDRDDRLTVADKRVATLGQKILSPPGRILPWTFRLIGSLESRRFDRIAQALG